jgi:hypothetical protein
MKPGVLDKPGIMSDCAFKYLQNPHSRQPPQWQCCRAVSTYMANDAARCVACRRSRPLQRQPLQGRLAAGQPRHHRGAPARRRSAPGRRPPKPPHLRRRLWEDASICKSRAKTSRRGAHEHMGAGQQQQHSGLLPAATQACCLQSLLLLHVVYRMLVRHIMAGGQPNLRY